MNIAFTNTVVEPKVGPDGKTYYQEKQQIVAYGTQSEEKPHNYAGGSIFIETDRASGIYVYMYDEANKVWRKQ